MTTTEAYWRDLDDRESWRDHRRERIARLDAFADLLDTRFVIPGLKVRFGLDALVGLVPGIGDLIMTAASLWLIYEARRLGAPWHVLARMLGNVAVDGAVGAAPLIGDAFDVMWRANRRNMRLLRNWLAPRSARKLLGAVGQGAAGSGRSAALIGSAIPFPLWGGVGVGVTWRARPR